VVRSCNAHIAMMLVLAAAKARAAEYVDVAVEFQAPQGCSDRETFAAGLRARSSRIHIAEANERSWHVSVRVTPKDHGVHGELRLTDERGASELRAVDGGDCAGVVEALSLTAALAIEQTVASFAQETQPRDAVTSSNPPGTAGSSSQAAWPARSRPEDSIAIDRSKTDEAELKDAPEAVSPSRESSDEARSIHVLLTGFVTARVRPRTSLGGSLSILKGIGITRGLKSEVGIGALYIPSDALQPKGDVRVGYWGAVAQACPVVAAIGRGVSLSPCLVLELAKISVTDRAADLSTPSSRWTPALGALGRARIRVTRELELELHAALLEPLAERRYYVGYLSERDVGATQSPAWQVGLGWVFGWGP
jgi:hypothetical protein